MVSRYFNWRTAFFLIALCIVGGTLLYTRYLARKIDSEERQRVAEWVEANKVLQQAEDISAISLANMVIRHNEDMPLIATDAKGEVIDFHNIDTLQASSNPDYLRLTLEKIKKQNKPIEWEISADPPILYYVYYGNTMLQREVQYYPLVQLVLVLLFIMLLVALLTTQNKSTQNQVWAGMAKETAHQMGTPLTSLEGWIEVLRDNPANHEVVADIEKDVDRLRLVSDRFGKIGSAPKLEETDIVVAAKQAINYMKKRASDKMHFKFSSNQEQITTLASPTLLDWVLENLLKNALDAMEGHGAISVVVTDELTSVSVEIADTGKGISAGNVNRVFEPGFTTKKRGWGLGLSLSRRIVAQYHSGQLYVKQSELGKGTTFRMVLPR